MSKNIKITFEQWCIKNNKQDILNRWDYQQNKCNPTDITYGTNKKFYFKCPRGLHKSELKRVHDYIQGHNRTMYCNACNSFGQWCLNNNRHDLLDRWDYELNKCSPNEVSYASNKKYYFKCPVNLHKSELKQIASITVQGNNGKCKSCNSVGQWIINKYGDNGLNLYWDYKKNKTSPFNISYSADTKVWIKCQEKDYHESYNISCTHFTTGHRCPYCSHTKIHPLDSLGKLYPQVLNIWSDKNKKTLYKYSGGSKKKVWWKCPNKIHEDYLRSIVESKRANFRCPVCEFSKGEKKLKIG